MALRTACAPGAAPTLTPAAPRLKVPLLKVP